MTVRNLTQTEKKIQVLNRARDIAEGTIPILFGKKTEDILMYLLSNYLYDKPPARYSDIGRGTGISTGNSLNYNLELLQRNGFVEGTSNGRKGYRLTPAGIIIAKNLLALITDTIKRLNDGESTIINPELKQLAKEELEEIVFNLNDIYNRLNLKVVLRT